MDAIIRFETNEGKKCFIAIETKYSENLGTNEASNTDKAIETIKQLKCFKQDAEMRIKTRQIKLTQIYRNFLLSERYGLDTNASSYSLVLSPERFSLIFRQFRDRYLDFDKDTTGYLSIK